MYSHEDCSCEAISLTNRGNTHSGFLSDIVIIKQKNIVNPAAITTHVPFLHIATDLEQVM